MHDLFRNRIATLSVTALVWVSSATMAFSADAPENDVPLNERPFGDDVLLLLPTAAVKPEGGLLERELLRQAVLVTAREELKLRTRDASLREFDPWGGHIDLGAVEISIRGGGDLPLVLELKRPARTGATVWTVSAGPAEDLPALASETEVLSRGKLVEALQALGFRGPDDRQPAVLAGRAAIDAALYEEPTADPPAELTGRFDLISQFAAVRAWHGSIEANGESAERLAGLVCGYANLGVLTAHHWSPSSHVYQARSLLYAARLLEHSGETPESLRARAYALSLLGLPAAALADLERAASLADEADEPPGWVAVLEKHSRGDQLQLSEVANDERLLATVLQLRDAELADNEPELVAATEALQEQEPACVLWLDTRLQSGMPLGIRRQAQAHALSWAETWLYEPLAASGIKLPAPVPEFDAADPAAEAKIRETFPADPFGYNRQRHDLGEPSLVAFGRMVQDEGFYQAWRLVAVNASALGVDADELVELTRPWYQHHPFRRMLDAYHGTGDNAADLRAALAETKDEPQLSNYWYFYDWAGPSEEISRRREAARRNADETVPDLVWLIDEATEDPAERRQLARKLEEIAPHAAVTVARLVRYDADRVADQIPGWEDTYRDQPGVMHAIAERHIAMMRFPEAIESLRAVLDVAPSHDTFTKLANAHLAADDEEAFVDALEESLELPSAGLEDARAAERIARHYMRQERWQEALPYAERAAASYSDWGLECEADVREALGEYEAAEALHRARAERYEGSRHEWYFWCLRTGRGDVWAARRTAEPAVESWRKYERHPRSNADDLLRLAFLDQVDGRQAEALERYTRRSERTRSAFDALMAALIADGLGRHEDRNDFLRRAVAAEEQDPSFSILARTMLESLGVPLQKPSPDAEPGDPKPVVEPPAGPILDVERGLGLISRTVNVRGAATNACYFLGRFLENRGRGGDANRCYELAASSPMTNKISCALAAIALRSHGQEVPARRGVELDGPTSRVVELYQQAADYARQAEHRPAVLRVEEALKIRPDHLVVLRLNGEMLVMLERFRDAAAAFESVLAATPYRTDIRFQRGRALEYAGDHAAAIAEYKRILESDPDIETSNDAHFLLAWLYSACADPAFRDASLALKHVGELKLTDKSPAWEIERTRAAALAAAGRFGEALRITESLLSQVPQDDRAILREQLELYRAGQPYVRGERWWQKRVGSETEGVADLASAASNASE